MPKIIQDKDYLENRIKLCELKFERAIDKCDYHDANVACAQKEYWERKLKEKVDGNK